MESKLNLLRHIFGRLMLIEKAEGIANAVEKRLPPNEMSTSNALLDRQIDVLLNGLASRSHRYKESGKWGLSKKIVFRFVLRIGLKKIGYTDEFVNMATKRIAHF